MGALEGHVDRGEALMCPFCGSTDIGHTTGGKGICLDCEHTWTTKSERREKQARRNMDWFDRLNDPGE
jgi:hypothetical protein